MKIDGAAHRGDAAGDAVAGGPGGCGEELADAVERPDVARGIRARRAADRRQRLLLRIPAPFGHRFRFDPDRIPADVGQRSGVSRTEFRRHPDNNPGRSGQCSGPSGQRSGASGQFFPPP